MTLAGRLTGVDGERLTFADDLTHNLELADRFFEERLRSTIDTYIERAAIEAPPADDVAVVYQPEGLTELNLLREGISTIIWATGYGLDYEWINAPLLDELGYPRNRRGVAAVPGLYFLGLLWQHSQASASLVGPGLDGPHLLEMMNRHAPRRAHRAAHEDERGWRADEPAHRDGLVELSSTFSADGRADAHAIRRDLRRAICGCGTVWCRRRAGRTRGERNAGAGRVRARRAPR